MMVPRIGGGPLCWEPVWRDDQVMNCIHLRGHNGRCLGGSYAGTDWVEAAWTR